MAVAQSMTSDQFAALAELLCLRGGPATEGVRLVPPPLELNLPPDALGLSFTDRMANFLQGKLPEQTGLGLRLPPASPPTGP